MLRFDIDTEPHPVFRVYSAGNFGEVAPERISIASWSLIGPPVEQACRALARRLWPSSSWYMGPHFAFVGYFACRPYHNLSGVCHMAGEVPRLSVSAVTACYFEDDPSPSPAPALRGSPLGRVIGVPRMAGEAARIRRRLRRVEAAVSELEADVERALSAGHGFRVGTVTAHALELLREVWDLHYTATMAMVPLDEILRAVGSRAMAHWREVALHIVQPHELPWAMLDDARRAGMPSGDFLSFPFYEIADHEELWQRFANRVSAPSAPSAPRRDSDRLKSLVDACWQIEPRSRVALLPQLVELVGDGLASREHSKSMAMRCMHVFRGLLPRLAQLRGISETSWPYLMTGELLGDARDVTLERRVRARRVECQLALTEPAPHSLVMDHDGASVVPPQTRARTGRGISAGVARGVAVRPEELDTAISGSRILVCDAADANLQPLLGTLSGVLTARGSALSHVAILMREYGIPAVAGHHLASQLCTGQQLELNGTTGEVTVL